jgi:hypothetical protein
VGAIVVMVDIMRSMVQSDSVRSFVFCFVILRTAAVRQRGGISGNPIFISSFVIYSCPFFRVRALVLGESTAGARSSHWVKIGSEMSKAVMRGGCCGNPLGCHREVVVGSQRLCPGAHMSTLCHLDITRIP